MLSTKYYGPGDVHIRNNARYILNDHKLGHQVTTSDGHERLITKDEWINVFPAIAVESPIADDEVEEEPEQKKQKLFSKRTITDVEYHDTPLNISKYELLDLMSHITPNHDSLLREVNCLMSAPMPKECIVEVLAEWYNAVDHKTPDDITDLVNRC